MFPNLEIMQKVESEPRTTKKPFIVLYHHGLYYTIPTMGVSKEQNQLKTFWTWIKRDDCETWLGGLSLRVVLVAADGWMASVRFPSR
jgi:hypothetical protein